MDTHSVWPRTVRDIKWPEGGVTYTYEHRGYIRPEKLEYWLTQLFGPGKAKYMLFNQRLYIKSPRKPTIEEREWMEDPDPDSGVEIDGYGWMSLTSPDSKTAQDVETVARKEGKEFPAHDKVV